MKTHQQRHYSPKKFDKVIFSLPKQQSKNKERTKSYQRQTNCLKQKKGDIKFKFQKYSEVNLSQKNWGKEGGKCNQREKGLKTVTIELAQEIWTPYLVRLGVVAGVLEGEQVQSWDIVLGATGVEGG